MVNTAVFQIFRHPGFSIDDNCFIGIVVETITFCAETAIFARIAIGASHKRVLALITVRSRHKRVLALITVRARHKRVLALVTVRARHKRVLTLVTVRACHKLILALVTVFPCKIGGAFALAGTITLEIVAAAIPALFALLSWIT